MDVNPALLGTLAVLNAPLYYAVFRILFKDRDEFVEAIWFWLKPDLWSALRGELMDDWWAEIKLGLFVSACTGAVFVEAMLIQSLIGAQ